jgi:hypothetical protein
VPGDGVLRIACRFTCGAHMFQPVAEFTGLLPGETARVRAPLAQRLIRALAVIEAFSYWKAFCSPVIEIMLPSIGPEESAWWEAFWRPAMGEFFYRNHIAFTEPGFLRITSPAAPGETPAQAASGVGPALVMFSGGKDSLALTHTVNTGGTPADFFLYNPAESQRKLAGSLNSGARTIEVTRRILPELLALNSDGHPNGHTPYSAYLAIAAMLAGYLRGNTTVLAGNSRSDDEPNVDSYLGHPVNHQWTKSLEFETALRRYQDRWLPGTPVYCSPLRPLLEIQIISSLSGHIDDYLITSSCNVTKGEGWCRACAKCAWVFLATSALFGHDLAVEKTGGDLFADASLADLYQSMAGLNDTPKPFECTGTEQEVRACIQAAGQKPGGILPALETSLANSAVTAARPLDDVLGDWGRDELLPPELKTLVRQVARLPAS